MSISEASMEILKSDVLVLGGGIAGCMAAIRAKEVAPDLKVTLFEKGSVRQSGCIAMGMDALNNVVGLASAHQVAGEDGAAADLFLRALQERPNAHWIHRNLAAALHGAGRDAEAQASRDTLLTAYPDMTVRKFKDAMVFSAPVLDRIGLGRGF